MSWKDLLAMLFWRWPMTPQAPELPPVEAAAGKGEPMPLCGLGPKADGFAALAAEVICSPWDGRPRGPRNALLLMQRNDGSMTYEMLRRDEADHMRRLLDVTKAGIQ